MKFFITLLGLFVSLNLNAATKVSYKHGGSKFEGFYQKAEGTSKGLVVVVHDWDGLTDYEEKRVQMLSKLGYDAFAVDLYGKGVRPVEMKLKKAETEKLYKDREKMRALMKAGIKQARKVSKHDPFVMGYCFGGAVVLELARNQVDPKIKGLATFHGGLATPEGQRYKKSPPIFVSHGGADSMIPMSDVSKLGNDLEAAGITYEIEVYSGAPHAYTVFGSPKYRKRADQKSWASFLNFLETYN